MSDHNLRQRSFTPCTKLIIFNRDWTWDLLHPNHVNYKTFEPWLSPPSSYDCLLWHVIIERLIAESWLPLKGFSRISKQYGMAVGSFLISMRWWYSFLGHHSFSLAVSWKNWTSSQDSSDFPAILRNFCFLFSLLGALGPGWILSYPNSCPGSIGCQQMQSRPVMLWNPHSGWYGSMRGSGISVSSSSN